MPQEESVRKPLVTAAQAASAAFCESSHKGMRSPGKPMEQVQGKGKLLFNINEINTFSPTFLLFIKMDPAVEALARKNVTLGPVRGVRTIVVRGNQCLLCPIQATNYGPRQMKCL